MLPITFAKGRDAAKGLLQPDVVDDSIIYRCLFVSSFHVGGVA